MVARWRRWGGTSSRIHVWTWWTDSGDRMEQPITTLVGFLSYDDIQSFALTWLPIVFMGLLVFLVWRTLKVIPRTKPQELKPESKLDVAWDEIAGADEAKAELREVVDFL